MVQNNLNSYDPIREFSLMQKIAEETRIRRYIKLQIIFRDAPNLQMHVPKLNFAIHHILPEQNAIGKSLN